MTSAGEDEGIIADDALGVPEEIQGNIPELNI